MINSRMTYAGMGVVLGLMFAAAGCNTDHPEQSAGTETHWLRQCSADEDCDIGSCLCGVCTFACTERADCEDAPRAARCAQAGDEDHEALCSGTAAGICLEAPTAGGGGAMGGSAGAPSAGGGGGGQNARAGGAGGAGATGGSSGGGAPGVGGAGGWTNQGGSASNGGEGGSVAATGGSAAAGGSGAAGSPMASGGAPAGGGGAGGATSGGAAGSGGHGGSTSVIGPPFEQEILFEVAYSNFAWGTQSTGWYLTREGALYRYDTGLDDVGDLLRRSETMTYEAVTAKYGAAPELVGSVDTAELFAMHARLAEARRGALVASASCLDAGESEAVGWLYEEAGSTYSPVLLGVSGDITVENTAPAAAELLAWLLPLVGAESPLCGPTVLVDCLPPLCEALPPTCPSGAVPSVTDDCWADCVAVTSCREVSSCNMCSPPSRCIEDGDGTKRCSYVECTYPDCSTAYSCGGTDEEVTCACAASRLCAGGSAFCQGSEAEGFRCAE